MKAAKKVVEAVPESESEDDEAEISLNVEGPDSESDSESESDNEEADDQTATLLAGFESSDDEDAVDGPGIDPKELAKAGIPNEKKVKRKLERLSGREKVCFSNYPSPRIQ